MSLAVRSLVGALVGALLLGIGCGPGGVDSGVVKSGGCDQGTIDCPEVQYIGKKIGGGFSGYGVSLNAQHEDTALQKMDEETQGFMAKARTICQEFNACVIDRTTYATRMENLRRRADKVPELAEGMKNAGSDGERSLLLARAYDELVEGAQPLEVEFVLRALKPGEVGDPRVVSRGVVLPTGTKAYFVVRVSTPAHVYLFQRSPTGEPNVLFPQPNISVVNPMPAATPVTIPQEGKSFKLNDKDIGLEKVFVVASLAPIPELERAAQKLGSGGSAAGDLRQLDAMLAADKPDPACNVRAFELSDAPACVRPRGLELADDGPTPSRSLHLRNEANDKTIAGVFTFQHTR